MTCKHEFNAPLMRKRMRDELNQYLRGRRGERKKEPPLMLVENQPYIHYNKGGMVFFALQDYIGKEKLNGAIKKFLDKTRYQTHPYTNTAEFVSYLKKSHARLAAIRDARPIRDHHTLQKPAQRSHLHPAPRQQIQRAPTLRAAKIRADSIGNETPTKLADYVDIGIFGPDQAKKMEDYDASGKALFFKKVKLTQPKTVLTFVVPSKPSKAGIAPYHKPIDRHYMDNVKAVTAGKNKGAVAAVNSTP